MKAIKHALLGLAASLLLVTQVTALNFGSPPPRSAYVLVNTCNGGALYYKAPWVYGVTASHCIKAPNNTISVDGGTLNGEQVGQSGDISYIRWQGEKPDVLLPVAQHLPKPGEVVWVTGSIRGEYLPVPAVWLGLKITFGEIVCYMFYGTVARGFSGSPVLNSDGEVFGIVSVGQFIDGRGDTSIIAPWGGASIFPHLQKEVSP